MRTRLQRHMLILGALACSWFLFRGDWRAALVLTATLAAAIVQLRWLASQVASLVALAASSASTSDGADPSSAEDELLTPSDPEREPSNRLEAPRGQFDPLERQTGDREQGQGMVDSGAEHRTVVRSPSPFAVAFLRPVVLLATLLLVFAFAADELAAVAAGALTLPIALLIEAALQLSNR